MSSFIIGIIFCVITVYVGMIYTSQTLVLFSFAEAVLLVAAFLCLLYRRNTIHCRIEVPIAMAERGKKAKICIVAQNRSHLTWMRTRCRIAYTNRMTAGQKKNWIYLGAIYPGENRFETYVTFSDAGDYNFSLNTVQLYDITGLFHLKKKIQSQQSLKIMPQLEEVRVRLTEPVRNFYGEADVYDEERPGDDSSEIFRIRPFQNGDRLQSIHWKLSAKMDDLMVREDSFPKACPVIVFLDYVAGKKRDAETADIFLSVAASLSMSLMAVDCPHYVVWYRVQTEDLVRVRVDDEESLYFFLNCYLEDTHTKRFDQMEERYREKFAGDPYIHAYVLDGTLCLTDQRELKFVFEKKQWKKQLQEMELIV